MNKELSLYVSKEMYEKCFLIEPFIPSRYLVDNDLRLVNINNYVVQLHQLNFLTDVELFKILNDEVVELETDKNSLIVRKDKDIVYMDEEIQNLSNDNFVIKNEISQALKYSLIEDWEIKNEKVLLEYEALEEKYKILDIDKEFLKYVCVNSKIVDENFLETIETKTYLDGSIITIGDIVFECYFVTNNLDRTIKKVYKHKLNKTYIKKCDLQNYKPLTNSINHFKIKDFELNEYCTPFVTYKTNKKLKVKTEFFNINYNLYLESFVANNKSHRKDFRKIQRELKKLS